VENDVSEIGEVCPVVDLNGPNEFGDPEWGNDENLFGVLLQKQSLECRKRSDCFAKSYPCP